MVIHEQLPIELKRNPEFPCYECDSYVEQKPNWIFAQDMFEGSSAWYHPVKGIHNLTKCRTYLFQESKESNKAYEARVRLSPFDRHYGEAISGFADLLTNFTLNSDAETLLTDEEINNFNRMGDDIYSFFRSVDELALNRGHVFILVEAPTTPVDEEGNPLINSLADEREFNFSPYCVLIDPLDVPNFSFEYINNTLRIRHMTLIRRLEVPTGFGTDIETRYRVITPGEWVEYIISEVEGEYRPVQVDEGKYGLDVVPVVPYYAGQSNKVFYSTPPLLGQAQLNLRHYQVSSDYHNILHKVNIPTAVRTGVVDPNDENIPPLILGPNTVVDLPQGATLSFIEPSGNAISNTSQALKDLEVAMDRLTLSFVGANNSNMSATEVRYRNAKSQTTLSSIASQKENVLQQIFQLMLIYKNNVININPAISVDENILRDFHTPQDIITLRERNLISQRTALELLVEMGYIESVEDEIGRLNSELSMEQIELAESRSE